MFADDASPTIDLSATGGAASNARRLSKKQHELLTWFRKNAPALAEAYEGAVVMLNDGGFPARLPFICHAVRDIADRLPFALDPQLKGNRVQYENTLDEIAGVWPKASIRQNTDDPHLESIPIPYKAATLVDGLVAEHRERRARALNGFPVDSS